MQKDIIVVGASAGGIEAVRVLVGALPADLKA
jgi:chemotaxis response regulator CheB